MKGDKDATQSSSVIVNVKQAIIMYSNLHHLDRKKKSYIGVSQKEEI